MRPLIILLPLFLTPFILLSQVEEPVSIHRLESTAHSGFVDSPALRLYPGEALPPAGVLQDTVPLARRVFGYHPYWGGGNYLNYRWGLLSDLCHFSYEVDPETGLPLTTHDWDTSPAIDSALAHGVRVHLCITLFSGHSTFFPNAEARQALIDQVIGLIDQRGAHGVNVDVEAMPLSQKDGFHVFMGELCSQLKNALPDAEVSIAAPAVNWSEKFDIPMLAGMIDFFMVMGYDYYWYGSSVAGPVSPLYPMTGSYDYSFSRTISYYQSQGVPQEKILMGVPYYAYQWKTQGPTAPSATIGAGAAYTYRYVMDNPSGNYSPANKHREPNSLAPYYSFELNDSWYQCFLDDVHSLGKKYDIINRRDLGGIGIWALGYDNGRQELWDLIASKFSVPADAVNADTIFDTGGPSFDYYDDEDYTYVIRTQPGSSIYLSFSYLDTEAAYDTLWIFDGPDTLSEPVGVFSGDGLPPLIHSTGPMLTLRFRSDAATTDAGWRAVYDTIPVSGFDEHATVTMLNVRPNPADEMFAAEIPGIGSSGSCRIFIFDAAGSLVQDSKFLEGKQVLEVNTSAMPAGVYSVVILCGSSRWSGKVVIAH